jgi:hypothetical protein
MEKTKKLIERKISGALSNVRRSLKGGWGGYTAVQLATDVLLKLSHTNRISNLPLDIEKDFESLQRYELSNKFLSESQKTLEENKRKYGVKRSKRFWRSDEEMDLERDVYRLTKTQILENYGIPYSSPLREIHAQDVGYAKFLRDNGYGDREEAKITVKDLLPIVGNDVYAKRERLFRQIQGLDKFL